MAKLYKCSECSGKVEPHDNFCEDCGAEFCDFCGEVKDDFGYCYQCDNLEEEAFWEKGEWDRDKELDI